MMTLGKLLHNCDRAILATLSIVFPSFVIAQPFGFSTRSLSDSATGFVLSTEIIKTNLSTGIQSHFKSIPGDASICMWDSDQQWLFVRQKHYLDAINTLDTNMYGGVDDNLMEVLVPCQRMRGNRLLLTISRAIGPTEVTVGEILDTDSLRLIDSVARDLADVESAYPSEDGSMVYLAVFDTLRRERALEAYSLGKKKPIWRKRLHDIGPPTIYKNIEDGKRGKLLVGYEWPGSTIKDGRFLVYDPVSGATSPPVGFPFREEAILSPTAKQIIAQRAELDSSTRGWYLDRTGEVWVFDVASGETRSKLRLPPGGVVHVFDSDTLHFYYYIDSTDTWIRQGL